MYLYIKLELCFRHNQCLLSLALKSYVLQRRGKYTTCFRRVFQLIKIALLKDERPGPYLHERRSEVHFVLSILTEQ